MLKPITESEWKGLTLQQANERASSIGYITRVVEIDGRSLMVDADAKSNRLNLRISNNMVTAVYPG